ncbi:Protein arginine N-methyltransferase 5 [Hypsibius exemplaris]|uniref:Protein arginine N-methyltransferase 5 n=1 Tax=Hypsibius exemplaris TaxID=2072580 RepID=A0A1W0XBL8_HYPEX|nr:Protein arginine N-methyltransferase 5 [Hypsibius exemplaris]
MTAFQLEFGLFEDNPQSRLPTVLSAFATPKKIAFTTVPIRSAFDKGRYEYLTSEACFRVLSREEASRSDDADSSGSSAEDSGISLADPVKVNDKADKPIILFPFTPDDSFAVAEDATRFVSEVLLRPTNSKPIAWFHMPIYGNQPPATPSKFPSRTVALPEEARSAYFYWHRAMVQTRYSSYLSLALELHATEDTVARDRWLSEPVSCIIIPISLFAAPVPLPARLSVFHRATIHSLLQWNQCKIMVRLDEAVTAAHLEACLDHLRREFSKDLPYVPKRRHLSPTMQPLYYNLCQSEYSGFEEDLVKYDQYEKAVGAALGHLRVTRKPIASAGDPAGTIEEEKFIVAVLGCGRGPLVSSVLKAAASIQAKVKVFALDKNPETQAILKEKLVTVWKDAEVELIYADMRGWRPAILLDIIVSELLGSFADDECSPECLEEPEKLLKPDGISIPTSYSNYLEPVSSTRMYRELRARSFDSRQQMRVFGWYRTPCLKLAAEEKRVLTFFQGPPGKDVKVTLRETLVDFVAVTDGVLHGFAGSFTADLYGGFTLSTVQGKETPGLFSWGVIFFPLLEPVRVLAGDQIQLEFRRCGDLFRIWYEWRLRSPRSSPMHNVDGDALEFPLYFSD